LGDSENIIVLSAVRSTQRAKKKGKEILSSFFAAHCAFTEMLSVQLTRSKRMWHMRKIVEALDAVA
jgi:hypothetical protein